MEAEFGGLLLEVLEAAGQGGWGLFEGLLFVVGNAPGDHRVEDAGEFVGGGGQASALPSRAFILRQYSASLLSLWRRLCAARRRAAATRICAGPGGVELLEPLATERDIVGAGRRHVLCRGRPHRSKDDCWLE